MVIRAFGAAPTRDRAEILLGAMPPLLVHRSQRLTCISSGETADAVLRPCSKSRDANVRLWHQADIGDAGARPLTTARSGPDGGRLL